MTPQALLNTLAVEGFQVRAAGECLELTGPLGRLTPELRQANRVSKTDLLQLLPVSYESAERYAIQNEATAPPEADDWPEELTWSKVREAVATGVPPNGWQFTDVSPQPKPWQHRPLCNAVKPPLDD